MSDSITCLLGAGFSYVAGLPLASELLQPKHDVIAMSKGSLRRFRYVREHYERWLSDHPSTLPEQYMGLVYTRTCGPDAPMWEWVVEYICAVLASASTPTASLNRNPRYSNRINRPFHCPIHHQFWQTLFQITKNVSVVTTNYDILVERVLRHRPMHRPPSPGCYYGGIPRPQILKGAAQPFSRKVADRTIEMDGSIPIFKLHGSLNWTVNESTLVAFQDMRPVFRHGGNAAIIPPVPEKRAPDWLTSVWHGAEANLRASSLWIICGYSLPLYDIEIRKLLRSAGSGRVLEIVLMSPDSIALRSNWEELIPSAQVNCLPGLPDSIEGLHRELEKHFGVGN